MVGYIIGKNCLQPKLNLAAYAKPPCQFQHVENGWKQMSQFFWLNLEKWSYLEKSFNTGLAILFPTHVEQHGDIVLGTVLK